MQIEPATSHRSALEDTQKWREPTLTLHDVRRPTFSSWLPSLSCIVIERLCLVLERRFETRMHAPYPPQFDGRGYPEFFQTQSGQVPCVHAFVSRVMQRCLATKGSHSFTILFTHETTTHYSQLAPLLLYRIAPPQCLVHSLPREIDVGFCRIINRRGISSSSDACM
jgi:hypothetical protein